MCIRAVVNEGYFLTHGVCNNITAHPEEPRMPFMTCDSAQRQKSILQRLIMNHSVSFISQRKVRGKKRGRHNFSATYRPRLRLTRLVATKNHLPYLKFKFIRTKKLPPLFFRFLFIFVFLYLFQISFKFQKLFRSGLLFSGGGGHPYFLCRRNVSIMSHSLPAYLPECLLAMRLNETINYIYATFALQINCHKTSISKYHLLFFKICFTSLFLLQKQVICGVVAFLSKT